MNIEQRIATLDWHSLAGSLDEWGYAKTPPLLTPAECSELIDLYSDNSKFRSRVNMAQHNFGVGEYKYFCDPLPPIVGFIRAAMYPPLSSIANRWMESLERPERYPPSLKSFLARCSEHDQTKPTPLLLRYETGGYNCLHQDLYGPLAFPLQITSLLSRRGIDYTGGEFLLVEQRPRAQSRGWVITLEQGEAVIFPVRDRPVKGSRGHYRTNMRHGVSRLESGTRYSLGVIFHNAK